MKILIVGPSWVGDMVMAQTLFKVLKRNHPSSIIDVLAPKHSSPLLQRMPEVNQHHTLPYAHGELNLWSRYKLGRQLRSLQYDWAITLPNSFKSALIPFWAKIPKRTAWLGECRYGIVNDVRYLDKEQLPLMIQRFVALAANDWFPLREDIPTPVLSVDERQAFATAERLELSGYRKPIVALCPGAEFGPAKRWPPEHYAAVAKHYLEKGYAVWLFGSPKEADAAETIQSASEHQCVNLVGKTSLAEAIDLMSLCHIVVSNDSGLMHVAAALEKPLIVLYGSTSPKFTPPLNNNAKILQQQLDCSPCFKRECPLQHMNCLKLLEPEMVIQAVDSMDVSY